MKLKLESFGPIRKAEIDLAKDFILIVGQNNIGKSYAISFIYALFKSFNRSRRSGFYFFDEDFEPRLPPEARKIASSITERISSERNQDIDITNEMSQMFRSTVEARIIPLLLQTLNGTFSDVSNLQNRRTSSPLKICLESERFRLTVGAEGNALYVKELDIKSYTYIVRKVKQNRYPRKSEQYTVIYYPDGNQKHFEVSLTAVMRVLTHELITSVCGDVHDFHYLPASRSGLYQSLSAFGQIVAELAKNRTALRQKIELPGISEPLSDYYLKLSDIKPMPPSESSKQFQEIASAIEGKILQGSVEFEPKTRRLLFKPVDIDLMLDLAATSSMVSEISPIASYLKYVLPRSFVNISRAIETEGGISQLMILEEPEAHLHPKIQVELVGILADLVTKTNTKIIVTSHSNYIFNKCSNLLMAGRLKQAGFEALLFEPGLEGSNTADLSVSRLGISDENFVDTAEEIYEERRLIIETLKNNV